MCSHMSIAWVGLCTCRTKLRTHAEHMQNQAITVNPYFIQKQIGFLFEYASQRRIGLMQKISMRFI